jgi:hypothetical protein
MQYTHITIQTIPHLVDDDFDRNMNIADQQKRLANAAPELLEVLREAELVLAEKLNRLGAQPNASPTYRRIRAAIAKATGGNHGSL